jgi:hypothetical protein
VPGGSTKSPAPSPPLYNYRINWPQYQPEGEQV